jgi:hypothetical protein
MGVCGAKAGTDVESARTGPVPLNVVTDAKSREHRIRDVFGTLFAFWDKDRDGYGAPPSPLPLLLTRLFRPFACVLNGVDRYRRRGWARGCADRSVG